LAHAVAIAVAEARGLTPPALARAPFAGRRNRDFSDAQTHARPGAASVSPPWLQEPRLQRQFRTHSDTVVAHAPRAADLSPPWLRELHLQRRYRHSSEDRRRCVGARRCNRGSETTGAYAPALARAPFAGRRNRDFSDAQTHARPGAAGVSPPWDALTQLQWRFRTCSGDCRRCADERRCNYVCESTGAYTPRSCSRTFARRRNCDFYDARTHTRQERRASARRAARNALAGECDLRR